MANTHEVTVHVWRNGAGFEDMQDSRSVPGHRAADFDPGHAALKLQTVGAMKGDYFYLSFWPGQRAKDGSRVSHRMTLRYGAGSLTRAQGVIAPRRKAFQNSEEAHDKAWEDDNSADLTYRFTGPDFGRMRNFMHRLGREQRTWTLKYYNCSQAVAECLTQGGAPDRPPHGTKFTPNRVGEWCDALVRDHYGGEIKDNIRGTLEVVPLVF